MDFNCGIFNCETKEGVNLKNANSYCRSSIYSVYQIGVNTSGNISLWRGPKENYFQSVGEGGAWLQPIDIAVIFRK